MQSLFKRRVYLKKKQVLTFHGKPFEPFDRRFSGLYNAGMRKVKDLFTKDGKTLTFSGLNSTIHVNEI